MTSSLEDHLASYPCTAAGSRALVAHLRDDHAKAACTSPYEDHAAHSAMHAAAHKAGQREPAITEPAGTGSPGIPGHEHDWACASPQHGPDATYRCTCGETALGSGIGVTEQARDWFYAPDASQRVRVTTRHQWLGYHRYNSAAARALARHLRGEGFQSVEIDPGDPGAASLVAAWDATQGQAFDPTPPRDW